MSGGVAYVDHAHRHRKGGSDPLDLLMAGAQFDIKVDAEDEIVATGDGRFIFTIPADLNGNKLVGAWAYVTTPGSTVTTVQIRNIDQAHDLLSTRITIDAGEHRSYHPDTPAVPAVIDPANLEVDTGDLIAIDVDTAGTGAKGLGVILAFDTDPSGFGAKGEQGDPGPPGSNGTNGTNGAPGSVWYSGAGAPASGLGINGDYYLRTSNNDVYYKSGGSWAVIGNLSGLYSPGGTDVALADGGTGASLADPNADRIMFWDDSAGQVTWLQPGTGLTITGTVLDAAGAGVALDAIWDAKGDLAVASGADAAAKLPVGSNGQVLTADNAQTLGVKWATPASGGNVAADAIWDTKGDLAVATGADAAAKLPVGADGQVLTADAAQTSGVKWATPASGGGGGSGDSQLDYVTQTTDLTVSATSAATAQAFLTGNAVTYDGITRVKIEWWAPSVTGTGVAIAELYDGATDTGLRIGQGGPSTTGAPMYGVYFLTPSAGVHTYSIKMWRATANMTVAGNSAGIFSPAFLRVTAAASSAIAGRGGSPAELAFAQVTSTVAVASTTEASPTDVISLGAVTYDGSPIVLEFYAPTVDTPAAVILELWDDTTYLARIWDGRGSSGHAHAIAIEHRLTPSAGTHTYKIRAFKGSGTVNITAGTGTGGAGTYAPIQLRALAVTTVQQAATGWTDAGETWTYASADAPTFTFTVPADVTTKYSPGMRIRLTQTTTKYFIVTAVSAFSGGVTTITVYGGTDYTLANAAITSPSYSAAKAPAGFPLNPNKWTVTVVDSASVSNASATSATWYNLNSFQIVVPIGCWNLSYRVSCYGGPNTSSTFGEIRTTLSASSTTQDDATMSQYSGNKHASVATPYDGFSAGREKIVDLAAKTTYYMLYQQALGGTGTIGTQHAIGNGVLKAACAYL